MTPQHPNATLFPYTTLFRSHTWFPDHCRAEIGYSLMQETDRRKGYMSEAIKEVLNYGFTVMNLNRVEALIAPDNIADRKSTRLNSSHVKISYAVFCLKKKKK